MVSSINYGCSFITAKVFGFINDEPFSFNSATNKAIIMLMLEDIFISQALSSNNKINKARDKNTTERTDALEKTNCPTGEHSGGSASSQTLPSNQSCFLEVGVENKVVRRKEREKERDTSMYKHRVSEIHKVMKGQRAEGKQKVGAQRSSNEMARKDIKRSGIGSSSGLG